MHPLYNLGIRLYGLAIGLAALTGNSKARLWVKGRKNWRSNYAHAFEPRGRKLLWMHVSSLGEFEQGRPVLEAFRQQYPNWQIVLTFFSPSGYTIRKDYAGADFVAYLPQDTPANAKAFLDWLQPDIAIFVKYDLWANYLFELKNRQVPTLLISALFRKNHIFFKWYGGFWRRMLGSFSAFFLQKSSLKPPVEQEEGKPVISFAGDNRIDRVLELSIQAPENQIAAAFAQGQPTIVAGSSWPEDESMLLKVLKRDEWAHVKVIFAPHDISHTHIESIETMIGDVSQTLRFSKANETNAPQFRWLIIDNIGMLNTLYRYGWLAYIGGGFGKGIHNTLEPAAWGLPILFGPKYEKFEEARQMVATGGAFALNDSGELEHRLTALSEAEAHQRARNAVLQFLEENRGATASVMDYIRSIIA